MISQLVDFFFEATELDEFIADFLVEFDLFGDVVVDRENGADELLELAERRRGLDVENLVIPRDTFFWVFGLANLDSDVVVIATEDDTAFVLVLVLDDQATEFVDDGFVVEVAAEDVVESLSELLVAEEGFFLLDKGGEIHLILLMVGIGEIRAGRKPDPDWTVNLYGIRPFCRSIRPVAYSTVEHRREYR